MAGWWGGCVPHFWLAVKTLWRVLNSTVITNILWHKYWWYEACKWEYFIYLHILYISGKLASLFGVLFKTAYPKGSKICLRRTRIQRKGIGVAFWWQHSLTGVCLPLVQDNMAVVCGSRAHLEEDSIAQVLCYQICLMQTCLQGSTGGTKMLEGGGIWRWHWCYTVFTLRTVKIGSGEGRQCCKPLQWFIDCFHGAHTWLCP